MPESNANGENESKTSKTQSAGGVEQFTGKKMSKMAYEIEQSMQISGSKIIDRKIEEEYKPLELKYKFWARVKDEKKSMEPESKDGEDEKTGEGKEGKETKEVEKDTYHWEYVDKVLPIGCGNSVEDLVIIFSLLGCIWTALLAFFALLLKAQIDAVEHAVVLWIYFFSGVIFVFMVGGSVFTGQIERRRQEAKARKLKEQEKETEESA